MSTIEVDIPEIGNRPGTIGWLNEYLQEAEVRAVNNKNGETCLFLYPPKEDGEGLKENGIFLVKAWSNAVDYPDKYDTMGIGGISFMRTHVTGHPHYETTWFEIALTPAAKKRAQEFLDQATKEFARQWHNDGEEVPT